MSDTKPIEPIAPPIPTIKPPVPIQPPAADGGISGIDGAVPAPGKSLRNKEAKPYFLAPDNATDRMRSRPAAREIVAATPLIDGVAIFTELENLIDGAKSTVLLAYWALALDTKMVTDSDRTWGDMLIDAAGRGVKVRLLQTDFDPGIKTGDHTGAWYGRSQLLIAASKANLSSDVLQVVVSHHPAEVPATLMAVAMTDLYDNLAAQINADKNADQRTRRYLYSPGFWDKIAMDKTGTASPVKAHASYPAWPASHHQKIAIIDGRFALTGGANITPAYIDSSKHDKAVDQAGIGPWHDAYVKVEGAEIIRDFVSNYIGLWNQCRAAMDAFLKVQLAALKSQPVPPYVSIFKPVDLKESDIPIDTSAPKTTLPAIPAQMRRTVSVSNSAGPFFTTVRKDVLEGYALAISLADELVYIENQYFREELIGKAIIDRHKKNSKLKAIIVIPLRSEEVPSDG